MNLKDDAAEAVVATKEKAEAEAEIKAPKITKGIRITKENPGIKVPGPIEAVNLVTDHYPEAFSIKRTQDIET